MTLEQILELAREARKSPHARRVLHDALLEYYGDRYERVLVGAQAHADGWGAPQAILFRPRFAENPHYGASPRLAGHYRRALVFGTIHLSDLRASRRYFYEGSQEVVTVLVVRPRART